jgi:hypothetical protein
MNFQNNYSSPVRGVGPKGQDEGIVLAEIRTVGSGLVGLSTASGLGPSGGPARRSVGGVGGMTATLSGSGLYNITYPATKHVEWHASVEAPTGQAYSAVVETPNVGISGTVRVQVYQTGQVAMSGLVLSGLPNLGVGARMNPPTGTIIRLLGFSCPITAETISGF